MGTRYLLLTHKLISLFTSRESRALGPADISPRSQDIGTWAASENVSVQRGAFSTCKDKLQYVEEYSCYNVADSPLLSSEVLIPGGRRKDEVCRGHLWFVPSGDSFWFHLGG